MANENPAALAARVRRSRSAGPIARAFGAAVLADPERLLAAVQLALETFQQEPAVFAPYSSKYDAWLRHQAGLSAAEARGLAIFNDPAGGNCARCHPSAMRHGAFPQFTDFGYAALGVPRNPKLPANADPDYFDLGLCGPLRTDLAGRAEYCGLFRTPTLRNVATRRVFFHNGRFHRLEEVLHFYAGGARSYDDLPAAFRANLDRMAPFDRRVGGPPALDAAQIRDLIAFLGTLTDGYAAR
jgi:cytochrome c peroxidase